MIGLNHLIWSEQIVTTKGHRQQLKTALRWKLTARAPTAHPDDATAREWDDTAFDYFVNGRPLTTMNRAHMAYAIVESM